jgi:hypothetical protein
MVASHVVRSDDFTSSVAIARAAIRSSTGSRTRRPFVPNQRGFKEDRGFIDWLGMHWAEASVTGALDS